MATKKAERTRTARERADELRRVAHARERRRALLMYTAFAVVLLLIAVGVTYELLRRNASAQASAKNVRTYKVSARHVPGPLTYKQDPPAGGPHNPVWLNCGIYPTPVPKENAVHSLEHGAVWVTYRPSLSPGEVNTLKSKMPSTYIVMSPYQGLKSPVVASAWGKQVALSGPDDPGLTSFIKTYRLGPQTPESGASCSGGSDGTLPLTGGAGQ